MSNVASPGDQAAALAVAEEQLARQAPIVASARVLEQQRAKYKNFAMRSKEMLVLLKTELDVKATRIEQLESALAQRSVERATAALEPQARASELSAATAEILVEQARAQKLQNELLLAPLLRENASLEERCVYLEERDGSRLTAAPSEALLKAHADQVSTVRTELRASVASDHAAQQQLVAVVDEYRTALFTLHSSLGKEHTAEMNALRDANERAHAATEQQLVSLHAESRGEMMALHDKCADLKRAWSVDSDALRTRRQQTLVEHAQHIAAAEAQAAGIHAAALLESSCSLRVTEEALATALATGGRVVAEHSAADAAHEKSTRTLNAAIARSESELAAQQREHSEEMRLLRTVHEQSREASLDGVAEAAATSRVLQSTVVERDAAQASLAVAEQRGAAAFEKMREMAGAFEEYKSGLSRARAEWSRLEGEAAAVTARVTELEAERRSSVAATDRRVASLETALSTTASRAAETSASANMRCDVLRAELLSVKGELEEASGAASAVVARLQREAQSARTALQTVEATAAAAATEAHSCCVKGDAEIVQLRKQVGAQNVATTKACALDEIERAEHARFKREHEDNVAALDVQAQKNTELLQSIMHLNAELTALSGVNARTSRACGAAKSDLAHERERSAELEQRVAALIAAAQQFHAESEVSQTTIEELERMTSQDRLAIDAASTQIDKLGELLGAADMSAADTLVAAAVAAAPRAPPSPPRTKERISGGGTPLPLPPPPSPPPPGVGDTASHCRGGGTPLPPLSWEPNAHIQNGALIPAIARAHFLSGVREWWRIDVTSVLQNIS